MRCGASAWWVGLVSGAVLLGFCGLSLAQTDDPEAGPVVTYFGIANADDTPAQPTEFDGDGRAVYERRLGFAFSLVVEGHPGSNRRPVGQQAFDHDPNDPSVLPDMQVLMSRPLGDGSPAVCDAAPPEIGGVPATVPLEFAVTQAAADAMNDLGCRVDDGQRGPLGRRDADACTSLDQSFGFGFVDRTSTI